MTITKSKIDYSSLEENVFFTSNPLVDIKETVRSIRKKFNGSSNQALEVVADEFAKRAFLFRNDALDKRIKVKRRRILKKPVKNDLREEDRRKKDEILYYDGEEDFKASALYSLIESSKLDTFLDNHFNNKILNNKKIMLTYFNGDYAGNNNLFSTLILYGDKGRDMALKIPKVLNPSKLEKKYLGKIRDIDTFYREMLRLFYWGDKNRKDNGKSKEYAKYKSNLFSWDKKLEDSLDIKNPNELLLYSGQLDPRGKIDEEFGYSFENKVRGIFK